MIAIGEFKSTIIQYTSCVNSHHTIGSNKLHIMHRTVKVEYSPAIPIISIFPILIYLYCMVIPIKITIKVSTAYCFVTKCNIITKLNVLTFKGISVLCLLNKI